MHSSHKSDCEHDLERDWKAPVDASGDECESEVDPLGGKRDQSSRGRPYLGGELPVTA